jgi:hypothetical protein
MLCFALFNEIGKRLIPDNVNTLVQFYSDIRQPIATMSKRSTSARKDYENSFNISLSLASGCRLKGLISKKGNTFSPDREGRENWITVGNLGKKKGDKQTFVNTRPLLEYTSQEFIEKVKELRNLLATDEKNMFQSTNKNDPELRSVYSKIMSEEGMKKLFPEIAPATKKYISILTPKILRKMYGNLAHLIYEPHGTLNTLHVSR